MKQMLTEREIDNIISESIDAYMIDEGMWDTLKGIGKGVANFGRGVADVVQNASSDSSNPTQTKSKGVWSFKYYVTTAYIYGASFMTTINKYCQAHQLENKGANFNVENLKELCNQIIELYANFSNKEVTGDPQECYNTMSKLLKNCKKWRDYVLKQQKAEPQEEEFICESLQMSGSQFKEIQNAYTKFYTQMSKALYMFRNKFGIEDQYDYWSDYDEGGNGEDKNNTQQKNREWWNALSDEQKETASQAMHNFTPQQKNAFISAMSKMFPKGQQEE